MKTENYLPIIGLEVHVQLNTRSKMFCGCSANVFGAEPNTRVCPVCLGLPGVLPVPNKTAINKTIQIALALGCTINLESRFDRKHYFYPDLPKGYQITQYEKPIGEKGELRIISHESRIRIRRVHLEEDTGTLKHEGDCSLVNFNRSGIPLVEIVTEPDLHSAADAKKFLKKLHQTIRWIGVSDADMEKGSMRIEPSVSIVKTNQEIELPEWRIELKNINSFRYAEKAIEYEIKRLVKVMESGETPQQETRGFDENKGTTFEQRIKEEEADYRYFPEPDVPPLSFSKDEIDIIIQDIPQLPSEALEFSILNFRFSMRLAQQITRDRQTWEYFQSLVELSLDPKEAANLVINQPEVMKKKPQELANEIKEKKATTIESERELRPVIENIIDNNPNAVADYKSGDKNAINFLIGQVMKETKGKAEAGVVRDLLLKTL